MLPITPLKGGERYATAAEIRDSLDLPEMPITPGVERADGGWEPLWRRSDGTPLTILIRALSFKERRLINSQAKEDDDKFALLTCLHGIKEPKLTEQQIEILEARHPSAIDAISDAIWALCRFPASMVEAEVRRLAELPSVPETPADNAPLA